MSGGTTLRAPTLRATGLSVSFGAIHAVNRVDLEIAPGARHALIGPNGAGKTTLVNLLTGVLRPTAGRILLGERDIGGLSSDARARLGLARTFQINALFPSLTPRRSIVLAVAERQGQGRVWWTPLRRRADFYDEAAVLLHQLGLEEHADVPTAQLPYGKRRLLEIALALALRPRVLLLDEPAAGIPAGESGEVFEVIDALPDDIGILFIEHDMNLVFRFARRISVLAAGEILAEGTPAEIADDPRVRSAYLGGARV